MDEIVFIFLISFLSLVITQNADDLTVRVNEGRLRGSKKTLLDGTLFYSFKGIPYAEPPVGKLRFKAPRPPKAFQGIRDATEHGPVCTQYDIYEGALKEGSEDCLFLNVYTTSLRPKVKKAVMVFIHGGGNLAGSGNSDTFGPEFLLQHDVILVTMNYRLEVLGFLGLDIPEVPGNAGTKDQVQALKWIKQNIANFGGDPNRVTLFGQSSGSGDVTHHALSPMSSGLIQRVIAQSGVCTQDWAIARGARERAFRVGKVLGKVTNDPYELLDFLQSVPAVKLTNMTVLTQSEEEKKLRFGYYFVTIIEKKFNNVDAFLSEDPVKILSERRINDVHLLLGYNSGDGILTVPNRLEAIDNINSDPSLLVPNEIRYNVPKNQLRRYGERIRRFYVGNRNFTRADAQIFANMDTDIDFLYNIHRFAYYFRSKIAPVFFYRFNYVTALNIVKMDSGLQTLSGASHADDLFYLFYNQFNKELYKNQNDLKYIVDTFTKMWANYAKIGEPAPDSQTPDCCKWYPFTTYGKEYRNIDETRSMGQYAERERTQFWDKLYRRAGRPCMKEL